MGSLSPSSRDPRHESGGFAARLAALRIERGLTRQELADLAGVTGRTVRNLENAVVEPQEKTTFLLAAALEVEPAYLLNGDRHPRLSTSFLSLHSHVLPVILAVLVLAIGVTILGRAIAIGQATYEVEDGDLVCRDGLFGRERWSLDWKADVGKVLIAPWRDAVLVGLGCDAVDGGRVLVIHRQDGRVLDEFRPDWEAACLAFGQATMTEGPGFAVRDLRFLDIDGDEIPELLVGFIHGQNYPFVLAVYDRNGRRLGHYLSRGHISEVHVEDIDGDGCDEVIAAGTNNASAYQGATLIRLEEGFWAGGTFDTIADQAEPVFQDSSFARLVLPSYGDAYMRRLKHPRVTAKGLSTFQGRDGRILISASLATGEIGLVLTCDIDLNPVGVVASDAFKQEVESWPESVREREGFPSQRWLDRWLEGAYRFETGQLVSAGTDWSMLTP